MSQLRVDVSLEKSEERSDSMITQYDETEWETHNVPIDHCSQTRTSVMLMNSYFDFMYAKALLSVKDTTIKRSCHGCEIDHPSQRQHDCIMRMDNEDAEEYYIDFYFDDILKAVDESVILQAWEDIVRISNISSAMIDLRKMVISSRDFLEMMKTDHWKEKMRRMVLTIYRLENRFFKQAC